jgi:hypothetical protein
MFAPGEPHDRELSGRLKGKALSLNISSGGMLLLYFVGVKFLLEM